MNAAHQQLTALTQGSLPTGIYLLSHLQGLGGGYVHICWHNHQANGLLFFDELLNEILDLKLTRVQKCVTKSPLSFGSNIVPLNVVELISDDKLFTIIWYLLSDVLRLSIHRHPNDARQVN